MPIIIEASFDEIIKDQDKRLSDVSILDERELTKATDLERDKS